MSEPNDMSAPVTRGELEAILERTFEKRLAPYATREEMFAELARGFGAIQEWMRDQFRASNELTRYEVREAVKDAVAEAVPKAASRHP